MDLGLCPCGHTKDLVRSRIKELDEEISQLREVRDRLGLLSEEIGSANGRGQDGRWPCQREFIEMTSNNEGR
jgi:hypothetical protein